MQKNSWLPSQTGLTEARGAERVAVDRPASLTWRDHMGNSIASGTCHDLSAGGASIESLEPVPCATSVNLHLGAEVKAGRAQVRYCIPRGAGYRIGLEFTTMCQSCDGTGKVRQRGLGFTNHAQCPMCRGSGKHQ